MQFLCADTYFCPESELSSIGECGRHVGVYACGIDFVSEALFVRFVFGDYTFAVFRGIAGYVSQSLFKGVDGFDGHLIIQKFRPETIVGRWLQEGFRIFPRKCAIGFRVAYMSTFFSDNGLQRLARSDNLSL